MTEVSVGSTGSLSVGGANIIDELVADLVKHLPMKLRMGLRVEVLSAAVEEGLLTVTAEGKLVWLLESKTLLAYYCGRMW